MEQPRRPAGEEVRERLELLHEAIAFVGGGVGTKGGGSVPNRAVDCREILVKVPSQKRTQRRKRVATESTRRWRGVWRLPWP